MSANEGITVVGVEVENFHRLRMAQVEFVPGTGLVRVTGPNAAGKTTVLRAIQAAIGGAGSVHKDARNDESGGQVGRIVLKLTNGFTITRRISDAYPKGKLTVVSSDGGQHRQSLLDEWLGPLAFDPLAFFDLKPARRREILLSLGTDPELGQRLTEMRAKRQLIYDERTPVIGDKRRTGQVEQPLGERPKPVVVANEMERLGALQAQERERQDARRALDRARREIEENDATQAKAREKIEELTAQLEAGNRYLAELRQIRTSLDEQVVSGARAIDALPDPGPEMYQIKETLADADQINAALEPWKQWDQAQEMHEAATEQVQALTERMNEITALESKLIAESGIPIPGLTFDEAGEPLLNGRSLEVASGKERVHMAVQVAIAASPDLRICLVDDEANGLDLEGLSVLNDLALEHGFQVWACRIGLEGPGEIVVEDGTAVAGEPVAVGQ